MMRTMVEIIERMMETMETMMKTMVKIIEKDDRDGDEDNNRDDYKFHCRTCRSPLARPSLQLMADPSFAVE
jgi:hypothetical protein